MKRSWAGPILSAMPIVAIAVLLVALLSHFDQPLQSPKATPSATLGLAAEPPAPFTDTLAAPTETATVTLTVTATPGWPLKLDDPDMSGGLDFSPDGTLLASGQQDGSVILWDVASGTQKFHLTKASPSLDPLSTPSVLWSTSNMVVDVALDFSPDGKLLAVDKSWYRGRGGSDPGPRVPIEIWDVETGALQRSLLEEWKWESSQMAFSPDGSWLVVARSGSSQYPAGALTFWDTKTWMSHSIAKDGSPPILPAMAFTPDSKTLITMSGESLLGPLEVWPLLYWDIPSGRLKRTLNVGGTILMMALSQDGTKLALTITGTRSEVYAYTEVLDPISGQVLVERGILPDCWGCGLVFSPDGSLLAMLSVDVPSAFELIDVKTGVVVGTFARPGEWLQVPVFSPDGSLLAARSNEGHIWIWRLP